MKGSITPSTKSIPDLTIGLLFSTNKTVENVETNSSEKNMDTIAQYENVRVESFKENFLQILRNNIKEIFDSEFTNFKSKCEKMVQTLSVRYSKQIDHWQNELKMKEKIFDQLLKSLSTLTNSELESKNIIIHKLPDQKMIKKRKNRYNVKMTSTLNLTLLITNLMKRIAPRKLKHTLKETKQTIRQITLNPGM